MMRNADLIKLLQKYPKDADVYIWYPEGTYDKVTDARRDDVISEKEGYKSIAISGGIA